MEEKEELNAKGVGLHEQDLSRTTVCNDRGRGRGRSWRRRSTRGSLPGFLISGLSQTPTFPPLKNIEFHEAYWEWRVSWKMSTKRLGYVTTPAVCMSLSVKLHCTGNLLRWPIIFLLLVKCRLDYYRRTPTLWSTFTTRTQDCASSRLATTKPEPSTRTSILTSTPSSSYW